MNNVKLRFLYCFLLFILILFTKKFFSESFHDVYNLQTNKNIYPSQSRELESIPQNSKALNSKGTRKQKTSFKDYFESYFSPWFLNIVFDRLKIEKK